jgi:hypothetical protein
MRSGTDEGISFEVSRLTDDLFTDSFLGGGDASKFRLRVTAVSSQANSQTPIF